MKVASGTDEHTSPGSPSPRANRAPGSVGDVTVTPTPAPSRRMGPTLRLERKFWEAGDQVVCGIDEVGRGAWAGPVTVAAVVPAPEHLRGVRDSKKLTRRDRERGGDVGATVGRRRRRRARDRTRSATSSG